MLEDGQFVGDGQVTEMLNKANAWAMILDGDGMVVWEEKLPEELPRHYSSMDLSLIHIYPENITKGTLIINGTLFLLAQPV